MRLGVALLLAAAVTIPSRQFFTANGTGAVQRGLASKLGEVISVKDFGALGDNSTDDTVAINAAIQAAVNTTGFSACVYLPAGRYIVTDTIKMYNTAAAGSTADGLCVHGDGALASQIRWNTTDATKPVVRMNGASQRLENVAIDILGDSLAAVWYDGTPAIGRSTGARMSNLHINCEHHLGDGILLGPSQADNLELISTFIENCDQYVQNATAGNPSSGSAIHTTSDNVLGIALYHAFFNRNTIAFNFDSSTNLYCYDCEINAHDLIVKHFSGNPFLLSGGRSEGPKRVAIDGAGGAASPMTFSSYRIDSINVTRPNITASITSGTTTVTFSAAGYTYGDQIVLSSAGAAGSTLKVRITNMTDATHATVSGAASTTMTSGAMGFYGYNFAGARCTVSTTNTSTAVTFSSPWCMSVGDTITIVGAGLNGRQIVSCSDSQNCIMQNAATATLPAATWFGAAGTTTTSQPQQAFVFQSAGPYRIEGSSFGGAEAQVVFIGAGTTTASLSVKNNYWNVDPGNLNPFSSAQLPLGIGIEVGGNTFNGAPQGFSPGNTAFAALPAALNGVIQYCTDCLVGSAPCTGASTGALAIRVNGTWRCQ